MTPNRPFHGTVSGLRLGPIAPPAGQAGARREDMEDYSRWLKGS
jgi:hypothetical protein